MKIAVDWFFADTFKNCLQMQSSLQQLPKREDKNQYGLYIWFDTESMCPLYVGGTSRPFAQRFAEHWTQHLDGRYSIHYKSKGLTMKDGIIKHLTSEKSIEEAEELGIFERALPKDDIKGRFQKDAILRRYEALEAMSFACGLIELTPDVDYRLAEGALNLAAKRSYLNPGLKETPQLKGWADFCGRLAKLPPDGFNLIHQGIARQTIQEVLNLPT